MYLGMFVLLRIFRRQAGSVSIADLLVIVIIADAAQNGMAGDAKSVTEALLLIGDDHLLGLLPRLARVSSRRYVADSRAAAADSGKERPDSCDENMESEMITEDELISQLRQQGIENIDDVKECYLESNGEFQRDHETRAERKQGNKKQEKRRQLRVMKSRTTSRKLRFLHTIFAMERDLIVGGQAVMEGVMMRTPSAYAIACRKSDGSIVHDGRDAAEMERQVQMAQHGRCFAAVRR